MTMLVVAILGLFLVYEALICLRRKYYRRVRFRAAFELSRRLGRKLLVIGDPYNGLASRVTGADYGHGDVCADLTGCPRAGPEVIVLKGDVAQTMAGLPANRYVIFESCTLEYVDDPETVIGHMMRLAGARENVYTVRVEPWTFEAYLYPGRLIGDQGPKRIFYSALPTHTTFMWRELGRLRISTPFN